MIEVRIRTESVAWQEVDDDVIVLDERHSKYMRLIGSARVLWPLLVEGATVQQLCDLIVERFGVRQEQAIVDVNAFVAGLRAQDLLEPTL